VTTAIVPTGEGNGWVRYGETTFHFTDPKADLLMRLKNVRLDDGHVIADLFTTRGGDHVLTRPRVNLTSDRSLPGLMRALESAGKSWGELESYDWRRRLETMCAILVREMDHKGTVTLLSERTGAELAQPMLFKGFLPAGVVSALVAHGGVGKSLVSAMISLALVTGKKVGPFEPLQQGPVLYLDWENDHEMHERRLTRLCRGLGIPFPRGIIHYRAHGAKITTAESDVIELAYEHGAVTTILDSIGFAAGGDLNGSDVAVGAVNVLKHIPGSKIMVAHINKAAATGFTANSMPSGSAFFWNGAQAVFDLRASDPMLDGSLFLTVGASKSNVTARMARPLGVSIQFDDPDGAITPEPVEIRGDSIGGEGLPLHVRIMDVLSGGAHGVVDIARALDLDEKSGSETVYKAIRDMEKRGKVRCLPRDKNHPDRWGLSAREGGQANTDGCGVCGGPVYKNDAEGVGWCRLHWEGWNK
jgi:hypothetical protein